MINDNEKLTLKLKDIKESEDAARAQGDKWGREVVESRKTIGGLNAELSEKKRTFNSQIKDIQI